MPKKKTQEEFVAELKKTHPNLKVIGEYMGDKEYVDVYCTIHKHKFRTKPNWLHHGSNCKKCYNDRRGLMLRKDLSTLLNEMNERHNGKYTYPYIEQEYKNNKSAITIVCPMHGAFKQRINHHLRGQRCNKCNQSHLECLIESYLVEHKIAYIAQYHDYQMLGSKSLDFYLPQKNIAIECQGIQHFNIVEYFGGKKALSDTIKRDIDKYKTLIDNNIKPIYIVSKKYKNDLLNDTFCGIYAKSTYFQEDIETNKIDFLAIIQ